MRKPFLKLASAALALTALTVGSSAHAQTDQQQLDDLKAQLTVAQTVQQQLDALKAQVASLKQQLGAVQANHALALGPFVSVDPHPQIGVAGPNITFTGANVHIISGSGATNDGGTPRGLGNLIIGYDEVPPGLSPGDRGGSNNLVIGAHHKFTRAAFGGLVAGEGNTISNAAASVSGGANNIASGQDASVSGGFSNTAIGNFASVTGGFGNFASGVLASVSGGRQNRASGPTASVSGGFSNIASGQDASISGGFSNTASGQETSVSGGSTNTSSGVLASVSGGFGNLAIGNFASVSGGQDNQAHGDLSVVIGSQDVHTTSPREIAPHPPF